jgi:hypothetical protein
VADTRKDQSKLSDAEWQKLIDAINELHGVGARPPAYREFVKLHTDAMTTASGMTWEVHTMQNMGRWGGTSLLGIAGTSGRLSFACKRR